ncbi:MAG: hypothetical protein H7Z19_04730 [Chitinophagaceae bacterium]|nr:hypothetical protein [Rubrivivax sp.]
MSPTHPLLLATLSLAAFLLPSLSEAANPTRSVVVRSLNPLEASAVDGLTPVPQVDMNLRASAAVTLSAWRWSDHRRVDGEVKHKQEVQRRNLGLDAAVYASVPTKVASTPLLPATQVLPHLFDFADTGDSAQAWATMTAQGVPHLFVTGFGEFRADATASWTSRFTLTGTTSKEVVLRFMVPPTTVTGDTEGDAPAWWRARMRTDVLVNGFPAWSTEAVRLRADYIKDDGNGAPLKPLNVLQTFGDPLSFPTNDEDGPTTNDTHASNIGHASAARWVHLNLGRFMPGQSIDLSMIVRGSAFTETATPLRPDRRCTDNPAVPGNFFCSRATMAVQMGNAAPTITLMP